MSRSELYESMRTYMQDKLPDYLSMLKEMVAVNSFTYNPAGVNALGMLTAEQFADLGFTAEFVPSSNPQFGKHLVLTRNGRTHKRIGFVSHLDTVFPPDEEIRNNFRWRRQGSRIYGPGTVDIKGGTMLMYMMLDAIRRFDPDVYNDVTWVLLLDSAEEALGEDFGALCLERLEGPDTLGCLIFEGGAAVRGKFNIVVARKGMAICHVTVAGKAAHAGSAHPQGANALVQLAQTIQHLAQITDYEQDVTVNVGVVAGGTVTNRVPHEATAALEMRAFTKAAYEAALADIVSVADKASVQNGDGTYTCQVSVDVVRQTAPWQRNEATDRLFGVWQAAAEELGVTAVPEERGGLSDGNYFWDRLPTIDGLGPAGGNAHCSERSEDGSKDQEFCTATSFVPKALLNTAAVLRLAGLSNG